MEGIEKKLRELSLDSKEGKPSNFYCGEKPNLNWKACKLGDGTETKNKARMRYLAIPKEIPMENKPSHLFEQHSLEWHRLRNERLTASNFGCILGFFESDSTKILNLNPLYYCNHQKVVHKAAEARELIHSPPITGRVVDRTIEFSDAAKTAMEWGTNHELNGIFTFLDAEEFKNCYVKETGLWCLTQDRLPANCAKLGVAFEDLPKIGASPDGLVCKLKGESQQKQADYFSDDEDLFSLLEIKCPCPFKEKKPSKKEKQEQLCEASEIAIPPTRTMYTYLKSKPHSQVPTYYMPQIQCQMMVTGVKQCYYVCWTATAGANIFKIDYNEEYCGKMLFFIKLFYERYVLPKVELVPPENFFADHPEYQQFLRTTITLTEKTQLVKHVSKDEVVLGNHGPLFNEPPK